MGIVILFGLGLAVVAGTALMAAAFYDVAFTPATAADVKTCGCSGCGGCSRQQDENEIVAITSLIQRSLPRADLERIHRWTQTHRRTGADKTVCPLMRDDGACLVFAPSTGAETAL